MPWINGKFSKTAKRGTIRARAWNEPWFMYDEGLRALVARRLPLEDPNDRVWDLWMPELAPSEALEKAFYFAEKGKRISYFDFLQRYYEEISEAVPWRRIGILVRAAIKGQNVTLLCGDECRKTWDCHRDFLRSVVNVRVRRGHFPSPKPWLVAMRERREARAAAKAAKKKKGAANKKPAKKKPVARTAQAR